MQKPKYSVNQHLIETVLAWTKSVEIAIPEIKRPFVWETARVDGKHSACYMLTAA